MRIYISLLTAFMLHNIAVKSQSSLNFSVGYSLPMGSNLLGYEFTSTSNSTGSSASQAGVYGSFGKGWNFNATYTYSFSKNFGLDFGATYFSGHSYTLTSSSNSSGSTSNYEANGSISGWLLSPMLVLKTEPVKGIQPYAKFGFVLGLVSFSSVQSQVDRPSPTSALTTTNLTREYKGGLPIGLKGGIGAIFNAAKKTSFFAEILFTSMSYYPDKAVVTTYFVNGVDRLSSLSESQKTIVFKNEISTSSSIPPDPTKPSESQSSSMPFGNVLLNVGVNFKFVKANLPK